MRMRQFGNVAAAIAVAALFYAPVQVLAGGNAEKNTTASQSHASAQQATQDSGEQIYGGQLMTPEEREAYLKKMRDAKLPEDREKIQAEHIKEMRVRAQQRGVTLPKVPPAKVPSN